MNSDENRIGIKEYLSQALSLNKLIDSYFFEISRLKELSKKIKTCTFEEHHGSSGNKEPDFVRCIDSISDYEDKIAKETTKLVQLKQEIENFICTLDSNEEKLVLRCRYISGLNWGAIGEYLNMTERNARRIHNRAIRNLEKEISA